MRIVVDTNIIFSALLKKDSKELEIIGRTKLWTGDKKLIKGLKEKNLAFFVETKDLLEGVLK